MRWCLTDDDIVCFKNGRCVAVNLKPWKLEKDVSITTPVKPLQDTEIIDKAVKYTEETFGRAIKRLGEENPLQD